MQFHSFCQEVLEKSSEKKMEKEICPCHICKRARTCNWTCDALSKWAENKTFTEVANEFIGAYNRAAKRQRQDLRKKA